MSKLATFWTGDLSTGFPVLHNNIEEVGGKPTRKAILRNIEQTLSARWGGVTITRVRGVWWDDVRMLSEWGYKFEVYFNESRLPDIGEEYDGDWVKALRDDAQYIAGILRQKEVHLTIGAVTILKVKA